MADQNQNEINRIDMGVTNRNHGDHNSNNVSSNGEDSSAGNSNAEKLALENCCADQVIQSMFEHVTAHDIQSLEHRSDRNEIAKFSNTLLENELIFGSPNETVLETVQQKLIAAHQKQRISK